MALADDIYILIYVPPWKSTDATQPNTQIFGVHASLSHCDAAKREAIKEDADRRKGSWFAMATQLNRQGRLRSGTRL